MHPTPGDGRRQCNARNGQLKARRIRRTNNVLCRSGRLRGRAPPLDIENLIRFRQRAAHEYGFFAGTGAQEGWFCAIRIAVASERLVPGNASLAEIYHDVPVRTGLPEDGCPRQSAGPLWLERGSTGMSVAPGTP